MGTKRDYYEILGIEKNADAGKIKSAYRKLAKKYHPDTNSGDAVAEQKFKEATEAYNVLSDPEKKKLYDQFGHAGPDGGPADSGFYQSGDIDDLFGDIFGDLFRGRQSGSFRQGGFRQESFRQKGGNLHADISVTFEEAAFGCDKVITLSSPEKGQPPPDSQGPHPCRDRQRKEHTASWQGNAGKQRRRARRSASKSIRFKETRL